MYMMSLLTLLKNNPTKLAHKCSSLITLNDLPGVVATEAVVLLLKKLVFLLDFWLATFVVVVVVAVVALLFKTLICEVKLLDDDGLLPAVVA